ncbi:hypothetical protein [Bradyrhizobium sp. JYMT SZCCT0428]|uniref:hypothetical protein n=1 Tax=Bradyrhizobium sp. JYMT SZCCT0428 TaxID=2807673 RepID=UPI001BA8DB36|nr:hypothetical protein [Bradyrhizobium sp. JYMT SZCCT0428]MBR1154389.1 hypothetical protein [Bradyrhizobium sp. JYMT SZCCT0428]
MTNDSDLLAEAARWLETGDSVRRDLGGPGPVSYQTSTASHAVLTWTNAAFNRSVMLYDEARSLVDSRKLFVAPIVVRAFLENVGMLALFLEELQVAVDSEEGRVRELAVTFLNHSFWKNREFKNPVAPDDIFLTPAAREKYGTKRPKVPQPTQMVAALDRLLRRNVPSLSTDLAVGFYGPLSEWTHPSQTSITYAFTALGEIIPVPTSGGPVQHASSLMHSMAWCLAQIGVATVIRQLILDLTTDLSSTADAAGSSH